MKTSPLRVILIAGLAVAACTASALPPELVEGRESLFEGRSYLSGFPDSKTRRSVRDLYLGVDGTGSYSNASGRFSKLRLAIDQAVAFRANSTAGATAEANIAQQLAWESLEAALQGQLITGNFNLLKGLRVAFPTTSNSAGQNQRPAGETALPVGAPKPIGTATIETEDGGGFRGGRITDLLYAREHFARAISLTLEFMAADATGELRSTDLNNGLGTQFPQYTRFNKNDELKDVVNFGDPSDQGANDPDIRTAQTTGYLLGNILDRYGKAVVGIGDRLWKGAYFDRARSPGQPRGHERQQMLDAASTELRKNAHFQYLASLPLAATMGDGVTSTLNEFETCRVDQARVTASQSGIFIDRIRRGEIPKLDAFELNASTTDINTKIQQVKALGANAKSTYASARDAIWKAKTAETEATASAQQLRSQFTSQIAELTGIDPGVEGSAPYGGLVSKPGQAAYRSALYERIDQAIRSSSGSALLIDGSELGRSVLALRRAEAAIKSASNRVQSIPQQIKIVEDRENAVNGIILGAEDEISAYRLAIGLANSVKVTYSAGVSVELIPPFKPSFNAGVSVTTDQGAIVSAFFQNKVGRAEAIKQVEIGAANAEAEIRSLLLEQHQRTLELEEAAIQGQLAIADLRAILTRIDRLIEDHQYYKNTNATKWWSDAALMFEQEKEELDYDEAQTEYIRELYVLTKMLEARWAEDFTNPIYNRNFVPQTLGGGLYDNWTQPESLFNAKDVGEADNYLLGLQAWDAFLRNERTGGDNNYTSDVVVSLRQDIMGLSDVKWDGSQFVIDTVLKKENLKRFQAALLAGKNPTANHQLRLEFPLVYSQSSQSKQGPLTRQPSILQVVTSDWNVRLSSLRVRIIGTNTTQTQPYRLEFYQFGRVEIPRYFPRTGDKLHKTLNLPLYYTDPMEGSNSPYRYSLQASVGAASNPPAAPANLTDAEPSPFCNRWILLIENPGSGFINLHNIEDIELLIQLKSGKPPTFAF